MWSQDLGNWRRLVLAASSIPGMCPSHLSLQPSLWQPQEATVAIHTYIHVGTELSVLVLISFRYYYYYYYYCYYYSLSPIQGIYNYISEANHISGVYNFAAVLYLQFTQHVLFYIYNLQFTQHVLFFPVLNMFCVFYIITFRSMCAVPRTTVSLVPWFLAFLVLSEWFLDGSIYPCYYWYHFCFYLAHYCCCCCFVNPGGRTT